MKSSSKILLIIPAYNEQHNITQTLHDIQHHELKPDHIVINDGSSDDTLNQIKAAGGEVITLPFNLGIGGAVQTGFKYAVDKDYDCAVQVDGDYQHDTAFLLPLLKPLLDGEVDMTIGSRFIPPYLGYRSSFIRRIGIQFFSTLISALTHCRVTDPTSGFRAYNRTALKTFATNYPTDYPEPEAIVIARRQGLTIKEVPVKMRKRPSGHSSIRYLRTLYYMTKVTCAILIQMLRRKK